MKKLIVFFFILFTVSLFAQEGFYLLTTMGGDSVGDQFSVVSHIGDVNADGFDDVIVGAPGGDYAKLFFGGDVFDTIPDLIFRDYKQLNCQFGCSIAGDGDINGDGYTDIIIGASSTWTGPSFPYQIMTTGAAYVYFGGPTIDTTADLTLIVGDWLASTGWYYGFGKAVCIPGDLNGDGYDDFVIGAANDDYDAHGRAYIYFGVPNVDDKWDVLLEGEEVFDNFGFSLSKVGDMNKDGYDDVLIGAPMFHNNIPGKIYQGGKAYLVYGDSEISLNNSIEFIGDTSSYQYGRFISGLGDVNGDANNDLGIMGGEYLNIISGNDFSNINSFYSAGDMWYISSLNNLNHDGFNDFAYVTDSLRIFWGQPLLDTIPNYVFNWAEQVSYLGFINNDSTPEIAFTVSGGWDPIGKIYVYSFGDLNSVDDEKDVKLNNYELFQNYPNPFNSSTIIKYSIPKQEQVMLKIYDQLGRIITILVNNIQNAGEYQIEFNTESLSSGVYFYQLIAGNVFLTNKLILLK
ncbi:MAG: T9SS type A sorting domain-containing protein [Ignavibacteriaceae bacterium]|jgi:hypothetical protein|nr:T9SS type A sorting domain-containing protein [Ignavibacteriaceae bacterium]